MHFSLLLLATNFLFEIGSPSFRRFLLDLIPYRKLQEFKHVVDTMAHKSSEIFRAKKQASISDDHGTGAVAQQLSDGKDIMSLLSAFDFCFLIPHHS